MMKSMLLTPSKAKVEDEIWAKLKRAVALRRTRRSLQNICQSELVE
jgi:hypothetical protein